jgi:deazaflavin-dependent oxidoreductase (nitroreductase family)
MKASNYYNPIIEAILKSPFHGLLSSDTMLLTFPGRKSGRQYTTPINYAQDGKYLTIITGRRHHWWVNFKGLSPVTVRVRGQDYQGEAQILLGVDKVKTAEKVYRGMSHAQAEKIAGDMVVITIDLN